jgi:lysophospholipase L1-like esterase
LLSLPLFLLVALVIVEIAMRYPPKGTIVYSRHPNPVVQYGLDPGEHEIQGHGNLGKFHVSINRYGMRDKERTVAKIPGTMRIATIGDSITYGYGIEADERFVHHIERTLAAKASTSVEVLNFGVPGYNIVQSVARLEVDGLQFDPDLVLLCLVDNDLLPRLPILGPGDSPSPMAHFMIGRFWLRAFASPAETAASRRDNLNALRRLADLSVEHGFGVVLAELVQSYSPGGPLMPGHLVHFTPYIGTGPDAKLDAMALGETLGFAVVRPASQLSTSSTFLSDGHPDPTGHQIIGEHIAVALLATPYLDRTSDVPAAAKPNDLLEVAGQTIQSLNSDQPIAVPD